jgi:hypothetical protein
MCEHCLRAWFASCKVPPKTERYDLVGVRPNEPISYAEDHELYENRKWRENLGAANARLHGICNQTRDCGKPAKWTLSLSGEITDHCLCDDHRSTWDNCTNASIVPFVPDEFWTRGREVTVSPARRAGWTEPGAPGRLDGDAYRIDGSFPDRVADGVLAVLCDTTIVRVRASLSELYQRPVTEFLRVMLTRNGILSESPLPDLTLKTAGFRKRDSQLGFWLQGALFQAIGQNKGIEIVVVGEWMNGKDQDDDQVEINPSP